MIGTELREFVDRVMEKHVIDDSDTRFLQNDILEDLVITRDVVDVLVALDRAVIGKTQLWADVLTALVVDFAVWQSRPTGTVERDTAHWLVATLSAGDGPTQTAQRIAFEVVRTAERCDELLVSFAMRKGDAVARGVTFRPDRLLLAS